MRAMEDGEVDLAIGPHEGLRLVGHVRPAENDHDARLQSLQAAGDFERNAARRTRAPQGCASA